MKSIEQHEAGRITSLLRHRRPMPCGIECPKCGEELFGDQSARLQTMPPRKRVHCMACNWTGSVTI